MGQDAMLREAVAVFDSATALEQAIDTLLSHGFDRADLSLLAGESTVARELGHRYERVEELEDDNAVPRSAWVSTESIGDAEGGLIGVPLYIGAVTAAGMVIASGGTVLAALGPALLAGGAGAVLGSLLAVWLGEERAKVLEQQIEHGGLLLWVTLHDAGHETRALELLKAEGARDVHVHHRPAR